MSSKPLLQLGQVLNERYRIAQLIARGGFGEVYEALDMQLERRVALKYIFQPLDLNLLHNEVKILATHAEQLRFMPNVYDFWREARGAGYYIVMEYVEGPMLDERQELPWPAEQVITFLRALLGNLRDLHGRGVVHCDIKPINIKATPDHNLSIQVPYRLLDFGIARRDEHTAVAAASRYYGAPEQHGLGDALIDQRADLYSLGATAYFVLTGQKPRDARERYAALARGEPDNLPRPSSLIANVPPALDTLLLELMQLDRARRPADAAAALTLLDLLLGAAPGAEPKRQADPALSSTPQPEPEPDLEPPEHVPAAQLTEYSRVLDLRPLSPKPEPPAQLPVLSAAPLLALEAGRAQDEPSPPPAALLDRRGNGVITGIAWEPSGDALLIGTTLGVYRYDVAQASCTLWHATDRPVRQVGITNSGKAVLVATAADAFALPLGGGDAVPVQIPLGFAKLLSAPLTDVLAVVETDALRLVDLGNTADSIAWRLPEQLAGRALALSADGQTIVIGVGGQLSYLSPRGARRGPHQGVAGIPQPIIELALTPDGALAAVAGGDAAAVWRLGEGAAQVFAHAGATQVALTSDGELLAVADAAGVTLRRAHDGKLLPELAQPDLAGVRCLAFCPRDRLLAAAVPGELRIWRLSDGSLAARLDQFGAVGGWLAACSEKQLVSLGNELRRWSIADGQLVAGATLWVGQAALGIAAGGAWLASAEGEEIVLRRRDDLSVVRRLPVAPAQRHGLAISPDGARLLVLAANALVVYDPSSGDEVARIALGDDQMVEHAALTADGTAVAVHSRGQIMVRSTTDGTELGRLRPRIPGELTALALSSDGRHLTAAIGGTLALWEISASRARLMDQRPMGGAPAHHLTFAPDGRAIVALQGAEVRIWQLGDDGVVGEPLVCAHNDRVTDAIFVGEQLVTAGADGVVGMWEV